MSREISSIPAARLELYEELVARFPQVERKGANIPYTSLNGHMFSFLTAEGNLALRLPDEAREAFVKRYKTQPCVQHGRVMKEYVLVPDRLLKKTADLAAHLETSLAYIASLRPKPTARKKKKASSKGALAKAKTAKKKSARKRAAKKAPAKKKKASKKKSAKRKRP